MDAKVCPECGAEFMPTAPRMKYCSESCSREGAKKSRLAWMDKTGYRQIAAERRREERRRIRDGKARNRIDKQKSAAEAAQKRANEARAAAQRKCSAGDPLTLLVRAKTLGDWRSYWTYYQKYEIAFAEASGRASRRAVNGIYVYDDDFVEKVLDSMNASGIVICDIV